MYKELGAWDSQRVFTLCFDLLHQPKATNSTIEELTSPCRTRIAVLHGGKRGMEE